MSQFAILKNKDITGFVADRDKGICTFFLTHGVCVLTINTIEYTLRNYGCEDLYDLYEEVMEDPDGATVFGDPQDFLYNHRASPKENRDPTPIEPAVEQSPFRRRF